MPMTVDVGSIHVSQLSCSYLSNDTGSEGSVNS